MENPFAKPHAFRATCASQEKNQIRPSKCWRSHFLSWDMCTWHIGGMRWNASMVSGPIMTWFLPYNVIFLFLRAALTFKQPLRTVSALQIRRFWTGSLCNMRVDFRRNEPSNYVLFLRETFWNYEIAKPNSAGIHEFDCLTYNLNDFFSI